MKNFIALVSFNILLVATSFGQSIKSDIIIPNKDLSGYLKNSSKELVFKGNKESTTVLAQYYRDFFSENFYYNYKDLDSKMSEYIKEYSKSKSHLSRADQHMSSFEADTKWKLPFAFINGKSVDAYSYRHLARQHKMLDIAFTYFAEEKDEKYLNYFTDQVASLGVALEAGEYEKIEDGNGAFEAFRGGYRVLNWLSIHNLFLGEEGYSDEEQLKTIATLLQHGQHLYERNSKFHSGNHQTRGVSALAMLSIIFRDFEGTDLWYERSMKRLGEHLDKEINPDGFQFERSVHYHMSDIENYFFVYQLAKKSNIEINKEWSLKIDELFATLVKIGYPDKSAPVLQDDTNIPWAEKNDISGIMSLGYLLFDKEEYGYFASDKVASKIYWFLDGTQINKLKTIQSSKPKILSCAFEDTGYYIMREGWSTKDMMMVVSAGLDELKPDHQHGDMLGVQAMFNSKVVLPNYQVRYSLKDYELFKNSMVKNVALVDDVLQGQECTSNKGGSGFVKFKSLPNPNVIGWESNNEFDLFVGSHDGFNSDGVDYNRQVIFIKNDFWIVKDNFKSNAKHVYKQVWQGHHTTTSFDNILRSSFDDGSGLDILQINEFDKVVKDGKNGKEWSVVESNSSSDYSFISLLVPFHSFSKSIQVSNSDIMGWKQNDSTLKTDANYSLSKNNELYLFDLKSIDNEYFKLRCNDVSDLHIQVNNDDVIVYNLGSKTVKIELEINNKKEKLEIIPSKNKTIVIN